MGRAYAIVLLMTMFESHRAIAGTCSSRDGQKYCSCEYNQVCTSSDTSCACNGHVGEPKTPVLNPLPPRSSNYPVIRLPNPPRGEPAPFAQSPVRAPEPAPTARVGDDERTAAEYVRLAQTEITAGKLNAAIEYIDKGETRLLDRSVGLGKTFDPITDESIQQLLAAKQAVLSRNRERAEKLLDAALAAMQ